MRNAGRIAALLAAFLVIVTLCAASPANRVPLSPTDGVQVTRIDCPIRDFFGKNESCPPVDRFGMKAIPDRRYGDDNKAGHKDGTLDYFLGEWKFTLGTKAVIVRKWGINKPAWPNPRDFNDCYSFEIITTEKVGEKEVETGGIHAGKPV